MEASEEYALEKLRAAVETLATGSEGIRIRIRDAHLIFHPLRLEDFSTPEAQNSFRYINEQITAHEASGSEGKVQASLGKLPDEECIKVAETIVELYESLRDLQCEIEHAEQG